MGYPGMTQEVDRPSQSSGVLRQDGQILFRGKWWIFETGADLADDLAE